MNYKIVLLSIIVPVTLSSCTSLEKGLQNNHKKIRAEYKPNIYKNITNFSKSLSCMDNLLLNKNVRYTSLLIESLNDNTNQVKSGTRDMLISAISDMTIRSRKVKVIAYGKDSSNLISFLKTAREGGAYKRIPQYDIRGSISQFDKGVAKQDRSLGLFAGGKKGGGLGKAESATLDVMTLDLSVVNTRDMSIVSGVTSKNSIAIYKSGNSLDTSARINKLGIYYDMTLSRSEGKSQALRNLIELASIEIVGKLMGVPYWECLGAKSPEGSQRLMAKAKKMLAIRDYQSKKRRAKLKPSNSNTIKVARMPNNSKQLPAKVQQKRIILTSTSKENKLTQVKIQKKKVKTKPKQIKNNSKLLISQKENLADQIISEWNIEKKKLGTKE